MEPKNSVDDRVVYVAFNSIFHGQNSQIRKLPPIKKLVHKHQKQPQVAQLLKDYGAPVIYERLQRLLSGQVFETTSKAKCEFPELFEVSEAQRVERAIFEAEAAAGHDKEVEEALNSADRYGLTYGNESDGERTGTNPQAGASITSQTQHQSARLGTRVPSLLSAEFDFTTSYKILVKTQEVLELACFRFSQKSMPEILDKRNWHCPESAELNLWATEFLKRLVVFEKKPSMGFSPSKPLKQLFPSIAQIRHHAVHRIPVTARELAQFMEDGETLVRLFEDHTTIAVMSQARSQIHKAVAEMEDRQNMLWAKLAKVLDDVADKRAQLDRVEAEAIADAERGDRQNKLLANSYLKETIWTDDGAMREDVFAGQSSTSNGLDNDSPLDQLGTTLESDMACDYSKIEDGAMQALAVPSPLIENRIGSADGDSVAEAFNGALTESLGSADADWNELRTEKRELSSNGSDVIHGPETSGILWPRLLRVFGITHG